MADRKEIEQNIEQKLDEGERTVEDLKAKLADASDDAREEISEMLEAAERTLDKGRAKLRELAQASDDKFDELWAETKSNWHEFSSDVAHGWRNLSDNVRDFFS